VIGNELVEFINPSFEVTIETKRHLYCRSRQGGHIHALRRGSHRCAVSGDVHGIQELFERVEIVGIQLRDRQAGEMRRGVLINRHFVVASFVRTELRSRHEYDRCASERMKRTFTRACARAYMYRAHRGDVAWESARKFVAKSRRKTVRWSRLRS
jgi:hypothetical protein